jgi:hypothetical protein
MKPAIRTIYFLRTPIRIVGGLVFWTIPIAMMLSFREQSLLVFLGVLTCGMAVCLFCQWLLSLIQYR